VGLCAQLACIWEATARKAGNVHRLCDFADLTYLDFLHSAAAIGPFLQRTGDLGVGLTVLEAVRATRAVASTNTNLGMLLLIAPLAAVPGWLSLEAGLPAVLDGLTVNDSQAVYEAIRMVEPGGLGRSPEQDVHDEPTLGLRQVMALAADRDLVARQYANGFHEVFQEGLPALGHWLTEAQTLERAIQGCHLQLLARHPDTLIARKCGLPLAEEATRRAARVLAQGWPHREEGRHAFAELDAWLRADGHRRNPGASADLVAACLFAALREAIIPLPLRVPWADGLDHG
jgi:triphosphoribosyl-dephospho-CoA synthase